jgi:hypothetical protein
MKQRHGTDSDSENSDGILTESTGTVELEEDEYNMLKKLEEA